MIFLLNKPIGISSFNYINNYRKEHNIKKIGHAGTLDPLASGLLLVVSDEDTKLLDYFDDNLKKTYQVTFDFGYQTSTFDNTGDIINKDLNISNFNDLNITNKLESFILNYTSQIPPNYSAKKINGQRAYQLARADVDFVLKPQNITIYSWNLDNYDANNKSLTITLEVSKGFYIRSFVNDFGIFCNTFATMTALIRTKIGNLDFTNLNNNLNALDLIKNFSVMNLNNREMKLLQYGLGIKVKKSFTNEIILIFKNTIVGIGLYNQIEIRVKKLFGNLVNELLSKDQENESN